MLQDIGPVSSEKKKLKKPTSFFASKKIRKIEFGNDQWLEIRDELSFKELIESGQNASTKLQAAVNLLRKCIVNWRLLDEDGNEVPFSDEAIENLNPKAALFLQQECAEAVGANEDEEEEKKE